MNKYFKIFGIYLLGFISFPIIWILFAGHIVSNNNEAKTFGVGAEYFKHQLKDTCEYLEGKGCSCQPIVRTNDACKDELRKYVDKKMVEFYKEK